MIQRLSDDKTTREFSLSIPFGWSASLYKKNNAEDVRKFS